MALKDSLDVLKAAVATLSAQLADVQAVSDAEALDSYNKGYTAGFGAGQNGGPVPTPADPSKIYTQADLDSAVAAAKADVDAKLAVERGLSKDAVAAIQAQLDKVNSDIAGLVSVQVEAFKASIIGDVMAEIKIESEASAALLARLAPVVVVAPVQPAPVDPIPAPVTPVDPIPAPVTPVDPVTPAPAPSQPDAPVGG